MFTYDAAKKEKIPCNLCGRRDEVVLSRRTKTGLSATTVMCRNCALIYISPRMTKEGYDEYYKYHYRIHRDAIKGSDNETKLDLNFEAARKFGKAIANKYDSYIGRGFTVDVGSSTGGILYGLREVIPSLSLFGIEPSVAESDYARAKGVPTETALFEDFRRDLRGKAKNVLCVQSLNHLLDPMGFLHWSHEVLDDDGHLFLAVKNFRHQVRRAGFIEAGIQIDHVYMFIPETLSRMVEAAGFKIVALDVDEKKSAAEISEQKKEGFNIHHIRLVARKIPMTEGNNGTKADVSYNALVYWKNRLAISRLALKLYYGFWYSRHLAIIRRMCHIDGLVH